MGKRVVVRELLGEGDDTKKNPGTFANLLVEEDEPREPLGQGAVRVAVRAVCVNYPDLLQTVGGYQHAPPLPFTPGLEAAGMVLEVGKGVRGLQRGDRVAIGGFGLMREEVVVGSD
eukprot:Hpha_TRINITY_DN28804_c0_g1::TRINITY_DN28804_c0_g1_i1::g.112497::m.112497